jgi:hypothetical protein
MYPNFGVFLVAVAVNRGGLCKFMLHPRRSRSWWRALSALCSLLSSLVSPLLLRSLRNRSRLHLLSTQPPKAPHFPSLPCLIIAPTLKPRKKNPTHTGRKHDLRARGTDLGLDVVDGVRGLDLEGDGLTREAVVQSPNTPVSLILCLVRCGARRK